MKKSAEVTQGSWLPLFGLVLLLGLINMAEAVGRGAVTAAVPLAGAPAAAVPLAKAPAAVPVAAGRRRRTFLRG